MLALARKILGSANDRKVKRLMPRAARIDALEPQFEPLTNDELRLKTLDLKDQVQNRGRPLDDVLEESFALVREAGKRALGQRHYPVQLVGGMVLHEGAIAEMRTGEGKTLVATLPAYLNALTGKGVHIVTVNDYLARRDAEWMGRVYKTLGLTVGCIVHGLTDVERRQNYAADITYGTNNEFGFDYLRDNMKYSLAEMCQRGHHYAIVDEVDSILVDEARTPLIISGPTDDRSDFYRTIDALIPLLTESDFELEEKTRSVSLTEDGNEHMEQLLKERGLLPDGSNLYDIANVSVVHHVNQALRAHKLFSRDKDYIVRGDQVVLIDEFTGRMMEGRRLSEGLHQAIEAKEAVIIQPENVTLASITFQNFFRLYSKLAGMTGTAATEASEFHDIYKLEVVEIPTNMPIRRADADDEVYRTAKEKNEAILTEIEKAHAKGQPMLVGTVSIEKSEKLSELLKKRRIPHQVLNARYHEQEAHIIAQAGVPGTVTIATNMAGRGTDIQLGGNVDMRLADWLDEQAQSGRTPSEDEIAAQTKAIRRDVEAKKADALAAGGLYVLGSERHESRRIDNQLRGRTGRQGDPGESKFFVSVEDDLMRIFAPERMNTIMKTLGMKEGEAIAHPWMSKALETAQKRVEQRNFEIRKNLLKYDDVINDQRKAIFEQRREFMEAKDVEAAVRDMRHELAEELVARRVPAKAYAEQWDIDGLSEDVRALFGVSPPLKEWAAEEGIADEEILSRLINEVDAAYARKVVEARANMDGFDDTMRLIEKRVLLQTIDAHWREHLQHLDHLRSVVHLRGYGQRDPLNEFKSEAFGLFERLLSDLRADVTRVLMTLRIQAAPIPEPTPPTRLVETHIDPLTGRNAAAPPPSPGGGRWKAQPPTRAVEPEERRPDDPESWGRVGRNELCPCGSGKKFKHCHGNVSAHA